MHKSNVSSKIRKQTKDKGEEEKNMDDICSSSSAQIRPKSGGERDLQIISEFLTFFYDELRERIDINGVLIYSN